MSSLPDDLRHLGARFAKLSVLAFAVAAAEESGNVAQSVRALEELHAHLVSAMQEGAAVFTRAAGGPAPAHPDPGLH